MRIFTSNVAPKVLMCVHAALLVAPLPCRSQVAPDVDSFRIRGGGPSPGLFIPRAGGFDVVGLRRSLVEEVVKGAPYSATATTERVLTLPDGNKITQTNQTRTYRDSEGRVRREQTLGTIGPWVAQGEPHTIVTISDPVEQTVYVLDPMNLSVRILPMPPGAAQASREDAARNSESRRPHRLPGLDAGTITKEGLGEQVFFGVSAEGTRTRSTIPAGAIGNDFVIEIVREEWYSPELHVLVLSRNSDPLVGETVYRLEDISREEPRPELFMVPDDYEVAERPVTFPERDRRRPPQ